MKRSLRIPVYLFVFTLLVAACNDGNQGTEQNGQDTNITDTRRNSGDTSYFLKTDSSKQKDLVDPDVRENDE